MVKKDCFYSNKKKKNKKLKQQPIKEEKTIIELMGGLI